MIVQANLPAYLYLSILVIDNKITWKAMCSKCNSESVADSKANPVLNWGRSHLRDHHREFLFTKNIIILDKTLLYSNSNAD